MEKGRHGESNDDEVLSRNTGLLGDKIPWRVNDRCLGSRYSLEPPYRKLPSQTVWASKLPDKGPLESYRYGVRHTFM